MNGTIEPIETLAPIATLRTFLNETLHPAATSADALLLTTVRDGITAFFREERANFPWFVRWFLPFLQWFAYWRVITHLRSLHPDPVAALAAFQDWQQVEETPPNQTTPLNPDLLALVRCPKDQQPLQQWTDEQGAIWLVNPRLGYQYPVVDGIPLLVEREARQLDPAYHAADQVK